MNMVPTLKGEKKEERTGQSKKFVYKILGSILSVWGQVK